MQEIAPPQLADVPSVTWPLLLNTGRVRDQWHTMTRTGLSPRLASHMAEPFLAVHPLDAVAAGLCDGGLAEVSNDMAVRCCACLSAPRKSGAASLRPSIGMMRRLVLRVSAASFML